MTDTNETINDIIAEMKREAAKIFPALPIAVLQLATRIEAAHKRELPQPDPDWAEICEKCHDGEIEPECEYYGEPNGCNSPIYGEHPTAENSSAVGNAAKLREALETLLNLAYEVRDANSEYGPKTSVPTQFVIDTAKAALSAPPRNCDVGTAEEQDKRFAHQFCRVGIEGCIRCKLNTIKHRGNACGIHWAQMPYEEGGAR